jgi:hypothetical protein
MAYTYKGNRAKNTMQELVLPSSGGEGLISVPTRLGYSALSRILGAAVETKIDSATGEETSIGKMQEFLETVLLAALTDPRVEHNLFEENGDKIVITESWILHEMDEDDAQWCAMQLAVRYLGGQSAEGNEPPPPEKASKKSATTS